MTVLRHATLDDAQGIARVQMEGWRNAYAEIMPHDFLAALSVDSAAQRWKSVLRSGRGHFFVSTEHDNVIGFAFLDSSRDDDANPNTAEVQAIYILPRRQRSGIGAQLMGKVLLGAGDNHARKVTLWTPTANTGAIRFYERMEFSKDGHTKTDNFGGRDVLQLRLARNISL